MADALEYQYGGDRRWSSHWHLLGLAGGNRRVLDVGCASGYLAAKLRARGCTVVGVELDPRAAEQARAHCERVVVGAADDPRTLSECGGGFDVVLCGDVLEHMPDPARALRLLPSMLAPGGSLVVSIPNVAFIKVRLRLLLGRFDYEDSGILDRTHLRFFTLDSARRLFRECGWRELEMRPATYHLPYALAKAWPGLLAPQLVFRLVPAC